MHMMSSNYLIHKRSLAFGCFSVEVGKLPNKKESNLITSSDGRMRILSLSYLSRTCHVICFNDGFKNRDASLNDNSEFHENPPCLLSSTDNLHWLKFKSNSKDKLLINNDICSHQNKGNPGHSESDCSSGDKNSREPLIAPRIAQNTFMEQRKRN